MVSGVFRKQENVGVFGFFDTRVGGIQEKIWGKNIFGSINFKKQQQQWQKWDRESDGKGKGGEEEKVLPDMHASRANHSTHYCIMKEVKKQFPTHTYSFLLENRRDDRMRSALMVQKKKILKSENPRH